MSAGHSARIDRGGRMTTHRPDVVTRQDAAGRWLSQCLACSTASPPSFHKPIADAWRRAHIAEAQGVRK